MCQYIVLHATMNVLLGNVVIHLVCINTDVLCCHNIHIEATMTCSSDRQ